MHQGEIQIRLQAAGSITLPAISVLLLTARATYFKRKYKFCTKG